MKTKRTFKAVIAMALALILSLGTMSAAFAANNGSITWTVDDETVTCTYHSDLNTGTNTVKIEESDYYYFDLSELENGYYSVEITDSVFEYFCTPEKSGDKYIGWGDMELIDGVDQIIFNRNDKVDVAIVGARSEAEAVTLEVEYLGAEIESVELGEETPAELILHYDFMEYGTDEYRANLDTVVTFDSGKTFEEKRLSYWFDVEGGLKKGENTVTLEFAGHEFEQVLNVALISDYISGVEVKVPENMTAYTYYKYSDFSEFDFEEITVSFTDGTKQTYEFNYVIPVTLPNGREIELETGYGEKLDTHTVYIYIGAGNQEIDVIDLKTQKASLKANTELLKESLEICINSLKNDFDMFFRVMAEGNYGALSLAFDNLKNSIHWFVEDVTYEISTFIEFVF